MPRPTQPYADELLANGLAAGRTVAEAARAAGVSERTAYRRMKEPAVRARITEVRRAALDAVAGRLTHGMVSACDHLTRLIGHDNPHVQIRAAKTVLQLALQVRHAVDVEDQLGEPTRLPPVGPALVDVSPRPVALGPGEAAVDRSGHPGRDGTVDSQVASEMRADAPLLATRGGSETNAGGGSDSGEPATTLARSPAPDSPGQTPRALSRGPGMGAHGSDRSVSRGMVVLGLVVAVGLSFAATGTARTHPVPEPDPRVQTCQNLPKPATRLTTTPVPEGCGERPTGNALRRARARTVGAASCRPHRPESPGENFSRPTPCPKAPPWSPVGITIRGILCRPGGGLGIITRGPSGCGRVSEQRYVRWADSFWLA